MARKSGFKPGEKVPQAGQYQIIGPKGGRGGEITAVKREPFPPTPRRGSTYTLVDPTKHRGKK
jgi:hypothetical protein